MTQKPHQLTAVDTGLPVQVASPEVVQDGEKADRHFLFNCHRLAMDFGIHAALRALELNAPTAKKTTTA